MKPKIFLALLSSLMLLQAYSNAKDTTCDAHIELLSDEAHVSFDKMVLEAYSTTSGAKLEQS